MVGTREWIIAGALAAGVARAAGADHGGGTAPGPGLGVGWLLVAGGVVALALGAWAVLAPDRHEEGPEPTDRKRS